MPARRVMIASRIVERRSAGPCKVAAVADPEMPKSEADQHSALVR
jgi:LacI family transcriptional regulator